MTDKSQKKSEKKRKPGKGGTVLPDSPGRPKGIPNKATLAAREAIAKFVDENAERLTAWLDEIAEDNPKQAFECFMSVVEYHIPKLARSEFVGKDGEDLIPKKIEIEFIDAPTTPKGV